MGFLGTAGLASSPFTAPFIATGASSPGDIWGNVSGENAANKRNQDYLNAMNLQREAAKRAQYNLLGNMRRPEVTSQTEARLKALEQESKHTSLAEDPYFQSQRATMVQGGQQALSNVANTQKSQGISGGFSNSGSMADVYDRMGTGLADLGQQSTMLKDQKRDQAAQSRQDIVDAQINFDNAINQAKIAIEAGDSQSAAAMIQQAYGAREQAAQASRNAMFGLVGAGIGAAGSAAGGRAGGGAAAAAPAAGSYGGGGGNFSMAEDNTSGNYRMPEFGSSSGYGRQQQSPPYSLMARR